MGEFKVMMGSRRPTKSSQTPKLSSDSTTNDVEDNEEEKNSCENQERCRSICYIFTWWGQTTRCLLLSDVRPRRPSRLVHHRAFPYDTDSGVPLLTNGFPEMEYPS